MIDAPILRRLCPLDHESGGQEFESLRARHFGIILRTPTVANSTLAAAVSVRSSLVFDPMMRISVGSITSTRCVSARADRFHLRSATCAVSATRRRLGRCNNLAKMPHFNCQATASLTQGSQTIRLFC
jgi:hypothetical protein